MGEIGQWVREWGYLAVFLGSLVEGESVVLTASSMAAAGYLSITRVMLVAFAGTVLADQTLYWVGRKWGLLFFHHISFLKTPVERATHLLRKYDVWFIIACRFIYGVRVSSSIVIGAAGVPATRFFFLNLLSAVIWTIVSCLGGYILGDVALRFVQDQEKFEKLVVLVLLGIVFISAAGLAFKLYRSKKP